MHKLISVFGFVTMVAISAFCQQSSDIKTEVLVKSPVSWDGSSLPSYPDAKPEITILRISIPPGSSLPEHKHPVINAGVLLKGELTVTTEENKTLLLKAGDALVEVVNKWHHGKNTGKEEAVILVFYAGSKDAPITVKR
jgi:quercetin dioxygenase-like cupin family protein